MTEPKGGVLWGGALKSTTLRKGLRMKKILASLLVALTIPVTVASQPFAIDGPLDCSCAPHWQVVYDTGGTCHCDFIVTFPMYTFAECFPSPFCEPADQVCSVTFPQVSFNCGGQAYPVGEDVVAASLCDTRNRTLFRCPTNSEYWIGFEVLCTECELED